jgi:hypothetical protein
MTAATSVLVVANETLVGPELVAAVKRRAEAGPIRVRVIAPVTQPRAGYVVYRDSRRAAAGRRLDRTLAALREAGIPAHGDVVDDDPLSAVRDVLASEDVDEIIVSTHPETRSGWLRQGLVDRVERAARRPVEHVVVDLDSERDDVKRTLVVANQTVRGRELIDHLKKKAEDGPRGFIVISPQSGEENGEMAGAHERLAHTLNELEEAGLEAVGQVVHPDPFTAVQNALQFYAPDDIVISTFPETRSGWLRSDLIGRIQSSTNKPVEHVVSEAGTS